MSGRGWHYMITKAPSLIPGAGETLHQQLEQHGPDGWDLVCQVDNRVQERGALVWRRRDDDAQAEPERMEPGRVEPLPDLSHFNSERMLRDPEFAALVHYLEHWIAEGRYTPTELREACILAATRVASMRPGPGPADTHQDVHGDGYHHDDVGTSWPGGY